MGEWIEQKAPDHRHDYPAVQPTEYGKNSTWRCSCGQVFIYMGGFWGWWKYGIVTENTTDIEMIDILAAI